MRLFLEIAIACVLIFAFGLPRWFALNRFVTTDEILWLDRSGKFYYALTHRDFAATFQKSHPGVVAMWAGLVGYLEVYPKYADDSNGKNRPVGLGTLAKREFGLPLRILAAGRRIMVLLNLLALGLGFFFARRLFGLLPAIVGFLLIAFDPFHIALTRILHLDGLLADLMLLSLLAFLVFLKDRGRTSLIVSAVAAGLAWLTKSPGLFLVPMIFLLVLFDWLPMTSGWNGTRGRKSILYYLSLLAVWGGIGTLVFCLLWPAMWVDSLGSVIKVFTDAIGYAQEGHASAVFFNGQIYPNGEIPDISFYPISFLWRTTPVILLGLFATPIFLIRAPRQDRGRWATMALLLLALGFGALMTLGLKKFDRYIVPSNVALDLIAGVSLVWLIEFGAQFMHKKWRNMVAVVITGSVIFQAALAWTAFPYFFSYYNPLLGGAVQAPKVMQIGWGEGLDQAARYINDKPNSNQLRVMAWYGNGPFSYFSKSQVTSLNLDHQWSDTDWNRFNKSDYVVVYIHEWQRNLPAEVLDRLQNLEPEYSVWINGLEYVRVYKTPAD